MSIISMVQHAASSLLLSLFLSFPHLTGTLCTEISHCVMLMEKDGVGLGGV